jgi:hypothetical protein
MRMSTMIVVTTMVAAGHLPAAAQATAPGASAPHISATPFSAPTLGEADLQAVAGREDTTQIARNSQLAGVSNNSVGDNVTTGEARIDGNAFQNMSGLSILNVNTGNNVAINAAMNVNISITPGQ